MDYCALAPTLISARDTGRCDSYAPVVDGKTTSLGVETPVYRGGRVPATAAARRRAFVGWLGELLVPGVVLSRALEGHPNLAVRFRYSSGHSHVGIHAAAPSPPTRSEREIGLHNGWTVQSFAPAPSRQRVRKLARAHAADRRACC